MPTETHTPASTATGPAIPNSRRPYNAPAPAPTLSGITLQDGSHLDKQEGMSVMEACAHLAGEPHTEEPQAVSPVLNALVSHWSDTLDQPARDRIILPLIPAIIRTPPRPGTDRAQRLLIADWLLHAAIPIWARAAGFNQTAGAIAQLPPVGDSPGEISLAQLDHHVARLTATARAQQATAPDLFTATQPPPPAHAQDPHATTQVHRALWFSGWTSATLAILPLNVPALHPGTTRTGLVHEAALRIAARADTNGQDPIALLQPTVQATQESLTQAILAIAAAHQAIPTPRNTPARAHTPPRRVQARRPTPHS